MRTRVACFTLTVVLISSFFSFVVTILPQNARAFTLFVGGSGPGNYTTIQEAVDMASPGDTVFVYSGTYQGTVEVNKPLSLVGEVANSTIIEFIGSGSNVLVTSDWVNITGFSIIRSLPGGNNWGILVDNADFCSISNNIISSNSIGGIFLSESDHNVVAGNLISDNLDGIAIGSSNHNTITDNTFFRNRVGQVKIVGSRFNTISHNTVYSDGTLGGGVGLSYSDDNVITGNNFTLLEQGVVLYGSGNVTIINNSFTRMVVGIEISVSNLNVLRNNVMVGTGIFFLHGDVAEWSSHVIDTSNTVNGKPVYYWKNATGGTVPTGAGQVILANCTNVVVENQNISNGTEGVTLGHSSNNIIRNNNVSSHHYSGIRTYESDHNLIEYNSALDNAKGVFLQSTANTSVFGNTFLNNEAGISLFSGRNNTLIDNEARLNYNGVFVDVSQFNWITNNSISKNSVGISFDRSLHNMINSNTLSENLYGVYLSYTDNMVYHNSFIDNTNQAIDSGFFGYNTWDNGYPSGGNYWSDYSGTDLKMGPRQDIPGKDGIGDTPYNVSSDSRDRYPLLYPMEFGRPRPPTVEYANLAGTGHQDVIVGWELSPDDGGGLNSIIGYDVYRNTSYDPSYSGYQLVASLPSGSTQYVDINAGEGDPSDYFYIVCAVNFTAVSSCSQGQAGKSTRPLVEGTNLISIPLIQWNESIERVLQTVKFDKAWTYDAYRNKWISYMTFKPYKGELQTIDHKMGVWVNVTEQSNLTVAGIVPLATSISLLPGWNLVGYPSFYPDYTVGDLKIDTYSTRVEGFDPSLPPYFLKLLPETQFLETGYGYWVFSVNFVLWVVHGY